MPNVKYLDMDLHRELPESNHLNLNLLFIPSNDGPAQTKSCKASTSLFLKRHDCPTKQARFSNLKPLYSLKTAVSTGLRQKIESADSVARFATILINEHRRKNSLALQKSCIAECESPTPEVDMKTLAESLEEVKNCRYLRIISNAK